MLKIKKQDGLKLYGRWRMVARHRLTGEKIVSEGRNLIVTTGPELLCEMLIDTTGYDTGLTYCALGTDNTAPAISDVALGAEVARKAVTSKSRTGNEITFSTFFTAAECTANIKEAGMFGHSTASATPDSGVLFSHWLVSFDNSGGLYDLTFDYILIIG
jgi:hypothetical protein